MTPLRLSVVIPVYNEEKTLEELVQRVRAVDFNNLNSDGNRASSWTSIELEIVVVDDGSTDGTRVILDRWRAEQPTDMRIVYHRQNGGKGEALRTGFENASGDIIVIQDADLEYDPRDYIRLIEPFYEEQISVVYGSRFLGGPRSAMSLSHMVGNKGLTLLTNLLFGTALSDMETCYKCFRREVIADMTLISKRFEIEPELTAKILKSGYHIFEVPIRYNGRAFHEGKKLSWRDGFAAVWMLFQQRLSSSA
ncbi:glycosyltransferase family 2 protein [Chloroflexi bacterium TSY]|nr:glycosyltransferase family 2 protein [Chloroflexi bacterium TSY]